MKDEGSSPKFKPPLNDEQRRNWLRLIRCENVGPATFRDLINYFGSSQAALDAIPMLSARGEARRAIKIAPEHEIDRELEAIHKSGGRLITSGEEGYPPLLTYIHAPPPVLTAQGNNAAALPPAISIVGARNASIAGMKFAGQLAKDLSDAGFIIVSGLARGIDTAAHNAALTSGTIAVLAGGLHQIYPKENNELSVKLQDQGLLLSEMPFHYEARARDFPRRNRLVSGISYGTIVIEAARRSGTLVTARFANEQGRQVFAVPGSPLDPRSEGTNSLLKTGAELCTSAQDVVSALEASIDEALHLNPRQGIEAPTPDFTTQYEEPPENEREYFLSLLSTSPVDIDDICEMSGLPTRTVLIFVLELDLAGRLERHGERMISLIP